jgi:peptide/nickel transport system permease protein
VTGYLIRRVIQSVVVVFGVVLLTFILTKLIPGGAARAALGPKATPLKIQVYNEQHHYNVSIYQQFWIYVWQIVRHGSLGYSDKYNQSVRSLIDERIPKTLVLVGISTVFALLVAIPLGVLQVVRRNKPVDYVVTGASFVGYAMPAFLLGELLILWFALDLHWFSFEAPQANSVWGELSDPRALVLPVFSLAVLTIAGFSRYMRSSMMEALTEDYIRTARAKGAGPRRVLYRHALRNALIPIITLLGLTLPAIIGGAIITETVFNIQGLGWLAITGATSQDLPTVLGVVLCTAVAVALMNLFIDIVYAFLDPRVRYS